MYKGENIPYEIYIRPLDSWCRDLLLDPFLLPKFHWNAERHFKVQTNGHSERVISEPWTANAWWKIQVRAFHQFIGHQSQYLAPDVT